MAKQLKHINYIMIFIWKVHFDTRTFLFPFTKLQLEA